MRKFRRLKYLKTVLKLRNYRIHNAPPISSRYEHENSIYSFGLALRITWRDATIDDDVTEPIYYKYVFGSYIKFAGFSVICNWIWRMEPLHILLCARHAFHYAIWFSLDLFSYNRGPHSHRITVDSRVWN